MKLKKYTKGGKTKPEYKWSTNPNKPKQEVINSENYVFHGSDNQDLDSYLKGTQLLGDVVSFINPLVGRVISAPGDINDIVRNPKDFKNYITPFIPTVSKNGIAGAKTLSKVDRFNTFLTGATLFSDLPIEKQQNGGTMKNGGKLMGTFEEGGSEEKEFPYDKPGIEKQYNFERANELYKPDSNGHLPSVDDETGEWLKSADYPTAWKEYLYGYQLNPEVYNNFNVRINPEGYFGDRTLQYVPKQQNLLPGEMLEKKEEGGFVERKSKSGRVFKYKSYKI